jgi:hypothetical protein
MSDLAEKLTRPTTTIDGGARRDRASLLQAGAIEVRRGSDRLLALCPMDHLTLWEHRSGTGKDATYECIGERLVESGPKALREVNLPGNGPAAEAWRRMQREGK